MDYDLGASSVSEYVNDALRAAVEKGPWTEIPDPDLRALVRGYIADAVYTITMDAGIGGDGSDLAYKVKPERLPLSLPPGTFAPDTRERLARHLYATTTMSGMEWDDLGEECQDVYRRRADKALAAITGEERSA